MNTEAITGSAWQFRIAHCNASYSANEVQPHTASFDGNNSTLQLMQVDDELASVVFRSRLVAEGCERGRLSHRVG